MKTKETPLWEKKVLTIEEAAAYTGIGQRKLRELCFLKGNTFAVWIGNRLFLRREKMEAFLDKQYSI